MPNQHIFCNSPWFELQIYWDGGLGFCCTTERRFNPSTNPAIHNIKNMSIREWMDSEPMRQARLDMFKDSRNAYCTRCYHSEALANSSRRYQANQKSVIFTKSNFADSYQQSPHYHHFESSYKNKGAFSNMPVDIHIDLGNYCNLTCKMCSPKASSGIASQYVKWGITEAAEYIGTDWTKDQSTWDRVLNEISEIPNLKNIHFMGGETLITKRLEDFLDFMLSKNRKDLNFSFVTNGTIFNHRIINKLKQFQRVGIEISVETLTEHNAYQRQGTDMHILRSNIELYKQYCNDNISITIRPTVSILTIGYYYTLLQWCLDNQVVVKSLSIINPPYYNAEILPSGIKDLYIQRYHEFLRLNKLADIDMSADFNESNKHQIKKIIATQVQMALTILKKPAPANHEQLLRDMVSWCSRWDQTTGINARVLYPEFNEIFDAYGYQTI